MNLLFDEENTSRVRQDYSNANAYDKKYGKEYKSKYKDDDIKNIDNGSKEATKGYYTNVNDYLDSKGYFNPENMKKDKRKSEDNKLEHNKSEHSKVYNRELDNTNKENRRTESINEDIRKLDNTGAENISEEIDAQVAEVNGENENEVLGISAEFISNEVLRGITEIGFTKLTPIQEQAIPVVMSGSDIIGQAQTGTGKTAAFGIPLIQKIDTRDDSVQGLVLCPTRELAIQAADEIRKFSKYMHGVKVVPIYGGADITRQIKVLKGKVSIVVGTPGRVMDHMRRHTLKLGNLKMLVLDEADEMLNMGFRDDIETILKEIPNEHQTALFSATMPPAIMEITKTYLKDDAKLIKVTKKELTMPSIKQYYYEVNTHNKNDVAARLLDYYDPKRTLVFCNTKTMVDKFCEFLKSKGYLAEGLHGDLSQHQRDKVMNGFRNGTTRILIATDVAARGIDVDDVEAVINYDVPQDIEYYVHRIGRTGRAGRDGRAFTLVVGKEIFKIREIEKICKTKMTVREVPSVKAVKNAKAVKVFEEINKIIEEEDLSGILPLVEEKLEESGNTAALLAAALLKSHMGEEPEEIVIEKFVPRKPRYGYGAIGGYGRGYEADNRGGRGQRGRGDNRGRGGYGSGYGKGRDFEGRDSRGRSYGRNDNGVLADGEGRKSRRSRDTEGRNSRRDRDFGKNESSRRSRDFDKNDNRKNREFEGKRSRRVEENRNISTRKRRGALKAD